MKKGPTQIGFKYLLGFGIDDIGKKKMLNVRKLSNSFVAVKRLN